MTKVRSGAIVLVLGAVALIVVLFQIFGPIASPTLSSTQPTSAHVSGSSVNLPWPSHGEAIVQVPGVGTLGGVHVNRQVPIASVAKIMVAYVILKDHPLTSSSPSGPNITVTPQDVALYNSDVATQQSVLKVAAGETLTERQALEGLLIPSANNIAVLLAHWDAGSRKAFVAKMNNMAKSMGLHHTFYADVSGLNHLTTSSVTDQIKLAEQAMTIPAFASIVSKPQVTLPVAGLIYNYDYALGKNGIIGIKTGSTGHAGGCFVFDAKRKIGGKSINITGAVFGQGGLTPLQAALNKSEALVAAATTQIHRTNVVSTGSKQAQLNVPWSHPLPVAVNSTASFVTWPGLIAKRTIVANKNLSHVANNQKVGTLEIQVGKQTNKMTLLANGSIGSPSLLWRLLNI